MSLLSVNSPFHPVDPGRVVLETDEAVAFYDAYPITEGHALVVPKQRVSSLFELKPDIQTAVWDAVRLTREFLAKEYHTDSFNIGINDGRAAGQTITHTHIHVIPRFKGDAPDPRGGIRWIMPDRANYWDR
ncbi:MAG: HIT family protein [Kiritimatiellia bacterium]|jgi:diadenosine tetraphosphate (Ap4A) HIT family hydrolase|nr:HIT family protein [Kiritimatiellia bacterium]MDP6849132.1 HIT family protein [Kiritimatiellia bacterium]